MIKQLHITHPRIHEHKHKTLKDRADARAHTRKEGGGLYAQYTSSSNQSATQLLMSHLYLFVARHVV